MGNPSTNRESQKVLVVHNGPTNQLPFRRKLSSGNGVSYKLVEKGRIPSSIDLLKPNSVALILVDLSQDHCDNLDAFLEVRNKSPHMPVIVMVGEHNKRLGLEALQQGAQDYFVRHGTEPLDEKILSAMIKEAIQKKQSEDDLMFRRTFESLVTAISTEFVNLRAHEINRGLKEALKKVGEFVGVDRSYVFLFKKDMSLFDCTHEWCAEGVEAQIGTMKDLRTEWYPWFMSRMERLETVYVPRVSDLPVEAERERKTFLEQNIKSLICVPMAYRRQLVGFIGFDSVREEKTWSNGVRVLLNIIGDIFVNAIERSRQDKEIIRSEKKYRDLVETSNDLIWSVDSEGRWTFINQASRHIYGYEPNEMLGRPFTEFETPEQAAKDMAMFKRILQGEPCFKYETTHLKKDGTPIILSFNAICLRDSKGQVLGTTGTATDVTERKRALEDLVKSEGRFKSLVSNIPGAIYRYQCGERGCRLEYMSDVIETITGYPAGLFIETGEHAGMRLVRESDRSKLREKLKQTSLEGSSFSLEYVVNCADGSVRWVHEMARGIKDDDGVVRWIDGVIFDITEKTLAAERLKYLAYYDSLTDLPNRTLFMDRLNQALIQAHRNREILAVMFLDFDQFKRINDTLGHAVGDELLKHIARRLSGILYETDTVTRIGGDEFAILLPTINKNEDAVLVAEKLLDVFKEPMIVNSQELFMTCCIGVSFYPGDGDSADELLKNADTAMYRAKDRGRNQYQLYSSTMHLMAFERLALENNLRHALERHEFEVFYQPQVDALSARIVGMEALIRWNHPTLGRIAPSDFIPVAEETGLINAIGAWVFKESCATLRRLIEGGHRGLKMAVNLSTRQLSDATLCQSVKGILEEMDLDPRWIELELTESAILKDADEILQNLREFNKIGLKISIDDFGTGYSSLVSLKHFPIDILKIDRSFVRNITRDPDDAAIARAIISLAHSLRMKVIAEGVETVTQLEFLKSNDCDTLQGYLFSHPVPAVEFVDLLKRQSH